MHTFVLPRLFLFFSQWFYFCFNFLFFLSTVSQDLLRAVDIGEQHQPDGVSGQLVSGRQEEVELRLAARGAAAGVERDVPEVSATATQLSGRARSDPNLVPDAQLRNCLLREANQIQMQASADACFLPHGERFYFSLN